MASTKISALTTDSAHDGQADYLPTYDASAVTNKKVLAGRLGGFPVLLYSGSMTPADATTYYIGSVIGGTTSSATTNRIYIHKSGKLVKARIFIVVAGTLATTETSTISFRLNDTTDTTISSAVNLSATPYTVVNSALTTAVAEDDYFCIKWVTPTWATNPTSVLVSFQLWFV